ncbi:MAG TPA: calcium-binding protein, partial [Microvirga sp.]|nr:calcium-binding protein [Microvirga sp.]
MTTSIRKPGQSRGGILPDLTAPDAGLDQATQSLTVSTAEAPHEPSPRYATRPGEEPFRVPGTAPRVEPDAPTSTTKPDPSLVTVAAAASVIQGDSGDNELGSPDTTTSVTINGADGYDTLWGGTAADALHGDVDNDSLIGGAGNDTLDGGLDWDVVSYHEETGGAGIVLNLSDTAWTYGATTYASLTGTDTWGNLDTLLNIEEVFGSASGDVIYAADSAQGWIIHGNGGDDTLTGGGNGDTLIGGAGNDRLVNGTVLYLGTDAINADLTAGRVSGQGEDTLSGVTHLIGGEGNDTIRGGTFASTIDGGLGNDVLHTGGTTYIDASLGADTVHGGIWTGTSVRSTTTTIKVNASTVLTYEDLIGPTTAVKANLGERWVDEYSNGVRASTDRLFGNVGKFIGSSGNDTIFGSAMNDKIVGGSGNDYIAGFGGSDSLSGGDGNDTLVGSSGYRDTLVGGLGNDHYMTSSDSDDAIVDAGGNDTIETYLSSYTLQADIENLVLTASSAGTLIGNTADNRLTSGDGNDTLDGAAGSDTMTGGAGNDVYYIRDLGDLAVELNGTTGGTDTVIISVRNYD